MSEAARIIRFPVERRGVQPERLLTLAEIQDLFGGSERWWRYRISEGMPAHRWGKRLRFCPSEVQRWLEEERYGA